MSDVRTFSKAPKGLSEDTAGSVFASKDGGVWIGTAKGLNRVQDNAKITVYGRSSGLPSEGIGSLFEDRDGTLWVEDAGSTNGTLVNGKRISQPTKLRKGDRMQVGETVLEAQR